MNNLRRLSRLGLITILLAPAASAGEVFSLPPDPTGPINSSDGPVR